MRSTGNQHLWMVLGSAGLGAGLRLFHLGQKPFWFDEVFSVFIASQPLGRIESLVALNDAHPPLYYYVLHGWTALFGSQEVTVRALSALAGVAVVLLTYAVAARIMDKTAGLLASLIVAVSQVQVVYSQEARMYVPFSLLALASWAFLREAGPENPRAWPSYGLATAGMMLTHYYGFLVLASQLLYVLMRRHKARLLVSWLATLGVVVILWIPWIPGLLLQLESGRGWPGHRIGLSPLLFVDLASTLVVGKPVALRPIEFPDTELLNPFVIPLVILGMALATFGFARMRTKRDDFRLLLLAAVGPVLLSSLISVARPVFAVRYFAFLVPFYAIACASGIHSLIKMGARPLKVAGLLGLAIVLTAPWPSLLDHYRKPTLDPFDWKGIAGIIAGNVGKDDLLLLLPGFANIPMWYYLTEPMARIPLTPTNGGVEGPRGITTDDVTAQIRLHPRTWIVTAKPHPVSALEGLERRMGKGVSRRVVGQNSRVVVIIYERAALGH